MKWMTDPLARTQLDSLAGQFNYDISKCYGEYDPWNHWIQEVVPITKMGSDGFGLLCRCHDRAPTKSTSLL